MEIRTQDHIERDRLLKKRILVTVFLLIFLMTAFAGIVGIKYKKDIVRAVMLWAMNNGHNVMRQDYSLVRAAIKAPLHYFRSLLYWEDIPKLVIDIKFKHFMKLQKKRDEAIQRGFLVRGPDDFVPASIRFNGKTFKARLRLKGDLVDHLQGNKWSFRIKLKGRKRLLGLKTFSIQHPGTRSFQAQPLLFRTMREKGILTPRYFFVDVTVNGYHRGIMALEEHFTKELLESQERRESVILKFDESLFWDEWMALHTKGLIFNNYKNTTVNSFESSKVAKSEILSKNYETAVGLLRGFVAGNLHASQVFDTELVGRFLAISELLGARHGVSWNNIRFYYNPLNARLEPIAFDSFRKILSDESFNVISLEEPLTEELLADVNIFKAYKMTVQELAKEIENNTLQRKMKEAEKRYLAILRSEFPLLQEFPYNKVSVQAKKLSGMLLKGRITPSIANIKHKMSYPKYRYPKILHAYIIPGSKQPYLEIANALPERVAIKSMEWISSTGTRSIPFEPLSVMNSPIQLPPTPEGTLPASIRLYFQSSPDNSKYALHIQATVEGSEEVYSTKAIPYYPVLNQPPIPVSTVKEQLSRHSFLTNEPDSKNLYIKQGEWQITDSLIVPKGFTLTVPASTTLRFASSGRLISYGSLNLIGTKNAPVLLEGSSSSWEGIAVINADAPSLWSYVTMKNTTGIKLPLWRLTAGVTFYQSTVEMNHCNFINNQTEDSINIVRSTFSLNDVNIVNSLSDGLDSDFSEGTIEGGIFEYIGKPGAGGDGVDVSGSRVTIKGSHFRNINDKAISVGEGSNLTADNVTIDKIGIGVASKDGSYLDISDSTISNADYAGLTAYIKKDAYGPASIEARNIIFNKNAFPIRAQKGSLITIDGIPVEGEEINVLQLGKTIMNRDKRK